MKRILLVAGLALATSFSQAQERLTLERAVHIALTNNVSLRGAGFERDASDWGKLNAITNFLPRVELSAGVTRIDPESELRANAAVDFIKASAGAFGIPASALSDIKPFAYRDTYTSDITVVQPIYNGGAEIVGLQAANAMQDRSHYAFMDTEQDVITRVKSNFYTTVKAEELVALAQEAISRTQRHLDMTRRRADAGQRTRTDVLRWEVQLATDEGNLVNAENGLAAAHLQLNELLGLDLNTQHILERPPFTDSTVVLASASLAGTGLDGLQANSSPHPAPEEFLSNHPSMRVMDANLRLADAGVAQSWVNFKPRINLAFQYGWEKNNTLALDGIKPWALALQIKFPVFNSFGDYTNVQKANAEYNRTEMQVQGFRRGLALQATAAELNLRSARKRVDIARKGQREAEEVLASVTRRYETGGASNVDLIDVQTAYTSARFNSITAIYDFYIADLQLARATGTITQ